MEILRTLLGHWLRWACCMVTPKNRRMWGLHMSAAHFARSLRRGDDLGPCRKWWCRCEIATRFWMSYMSSGFYRAIIVYTLPLWLCRGSLADFVLNAFALVYIVELDDLTHEKKYAWKECDEPDDSLHGLEEGTLTW